MAEMFRLKFLVFVTLFTNLIQFAKCYVGRFGQCEAKEWSFRVLYNVDLTKCKHECERRPNCLRLNYRRPRKECSLYDMPIMWDGSDVKSCVVIGLNELEISCTCVPGKVCQPDESCLVEECPFPPKIDIDRGDVSGNVLELGSKVKVVCETPYIRHPDNEYITCDTNGQWEGFPVCAIDCDDPCNNFPFTQPVYPGGTLEHDVRTYDCDPGFFLYNNPTVSSFDITCTVGGWTLPPAVCVTDILTPKQPLNIHYIGCVMYEINTEYLTSHADAYDQCTPYGRLARLSSNESHLIIQEYLNLTGYDSRKMLWIQGTRMADGTNWQFHDGSMITTFFWGQNQPQHIQKCICMDSYYSFKWNDRHCSDLLGYICEYFGLSSMV